MGRGICEINGYRKVYNPRKTKGLKMSSEKLDLERFILQLTDIRQKLAHLENNSEKITGASEDLAGIGTQIEGMIKDLKADGAPETVEPESKVILVVDDNDELLEFVKQALELSNFNVLKAPDGNAAMTLLQDVEALDLVVSDVVLPGMKGPELVQKIHGLFPDVKTIFISGYVTEDIVNQDVEKILAGGGVFLQKPFSTRKLLEMVHDILGI